MEKEILSEVLNTLKKTIKARELAKSNLKEAEKTLQEELAKHKQYYKKDNIPDLPKIKMKLVKSAIEVNESNKNKALEELELQEEYQTDLKKLDKGYVESIVLKQNTLKDVNLEFKELKKALESKVEDGVESPKDIIAALVILAELDVKDVEIKDDKKSFLAAEFRKTLEEEE